MMAAVIKQEHIRIQSMLPVRVLLDLSPVLTAVRNLGLSNDSVLTESIFS